MRQRHYTLSDWPDRQCLQTKGSKFIGEHFHATSSLLFSQTQQSSANSQISWGDPVINVCVSRMFDLGSKWVILAPNRTFYVLVCPAKCTEIYRDG